MSVRRCPESCADDCFVEHHPLLVAVLNCEDDPEVMENQMKNLTRLMHAHELEGDWNLAKPLADPIEEYRKTFLHWATYLGCVSAVRCILAYKPPPTTPSINNSSFLQRRALLALDDHSNTPLHQCALMLVRETNRLQCYKECLSLMLDYIMLRVGAQAETALSWKEILNRQNEEGDTILHIVCQSDSLVTLVEQLIETGADTMIFSKGCMALAVARQLGQTKNVTALTEWQNYAHSHRLFLQTLRYSAVVARQSSHSYNDPIIRSSSCSISSCVSTTCSSTSNAATVPLTSTDSATPSTSLSLLISSVISQPIQSLAQSSKTSLNTGIQYSPVEGEVGINSFHRYANRIFSKFGLPVVDCDDDIDEKAISVCIEHCLKTTLLKESITNSVNTDIDELKTLIENLTQTLHDMKKHDDELGANRKRKFDELEKFEAESAKLCETEEQLRKEMKELEDKISEYSTKHQTAYSELIDSQKKMSGSTNH